MRPSVLPNGKASAKSPEVFTLYHPHPLLFSSSTLAVKQAHLPSLIYYPASVSGDHEYIDVVHVDKNGGSERLIIDIDFRSHFKIARAIASYDAILNSLPAIYIGSTAKLKRLLQIMADAAKFSLKQNSMPLPPWRSLPYLQAKWQSEYERKCCVDGERNVLLESSVHARCIGHLNRLKSSLHSD